MASTSPGPRGPGAQGQGPMGGPQPRVEGHPCGGALEFRGRRFHSDIVILVAMAPREFRGRRFHSDIAFEVSENFTNLKCDGVPGVPGPQKPMATAPWGPWGRSLGGLKIYMFWSRPGPSGF